MFFTDFYRLVRHLQILVRASLPRVKRPRDLKKKNEIGCATHSSAEQARWLPLARPTGEKVRCVLHKLADAKVRKRGRRPAVVAALAVGDFPHVLQVGWRRI
jgi:hypothetical protein